MKSKDGLAFELVGSVQGDIDRLLKKL